MVPPTDRLEIMSRFRTQISSHKPIIGAGAGIGLSAKSAEAGGADLIIIYNSGRFRMAGHGSLAGLMPFSNANDVVISMASEVLPVVNHTPVLAGVCATDPMRSIPQLLLQLRSLGFAGVQNFPTVGLIDGHFRLNLEETGMGFQKEIDMIATAHNLGLLTAAYVFDAEQGRKMAEAGADIVVAHMGLTTSGTIGAKTGRSLEECVVLVREIRESVVAVRREVVVLCHGGPIAGPGDAEVVLRGVEGCHGFFGASSMERLPVEEAIRGNLESFKGIGMFGS